MASETKKIMSAIESMGRGTIFFPSNFSYLGINAKLILKVLERATNAQMIVRLAMGIYCYPKIEEKYGLGVIYPTYEKSRNGLPKETTSRLCLLVLTRKIFWD